MANSKKRPPSSGILLFALAFFGVLVLSAIVGILWWVIAKPELSWWPFGAKEPSDTVVAVTEPNTLYDAADRLAIAVYITDEHHALQSVSLVMVCPDTAHIAVAGIPAELSLSEDETDTLSRRLRVFGITQAQEGLSCVFKTTVTQYMTLSYSQITSFLTETGQSLIVNLPVDIHEQSEDGSFAVHLTAGENALSAQQVSDLLKCTDYQDGRRERATMHARVIEAYLTQFLQQGRSLTSDYALLATYTDTAWTVEKFSNTLPVLEYILAEKEEEWLSLIPASGNFSGAGATLRFSPDTSMAQAIAANVPDDRVLSE